MRIAGNPLNRLKRDRQESDKKYISCRERGNGRLSGNLDQLAAILPHSNRPIFYWTFGLKRIGLDNKTRTKTLYGHYEHIPE